VLSQGVVVCPHPSSFPPLHLLCVAGVSSRLLLTLPPHRGSWSSFLLPLSSLAIRYVGGGSYTPPSRSRCRWWVPLPCHSRCRRWAPNSVSFEVLEVGTLLCVVPAWWWVSSPSASLETRVLNSLDLRVIQHVGIGVSAFASFHTSAIRVVVCRVVCRSCVVLAGRHVGDVRLRQVSWGAWRGRWQTRATTLVAACVLTYHAGPPIPWVPPRIPSCVSLHRQARTPAHIPQGRGGAW
jgi:hypothetical protein